MAQPVLMWICSRTRKDGIQNEQIHEMVKVEPIEEGMSGDRLRWFSCAQE